MTLENFQTQINRLRVRFGDRNFDAEFLGLLAKELQSMNDFELTTLVSDMIATRPVSRPPLLVDFREARLQIERRKFNREVKDAANGFNWAQQKGHKAFLEKNYPGCESIKEAVEVERFKLKVKAAQEAPEDDDNNLPPAG